MSTHVEAVAQVRPAAVGIIGTAVMSPERAGDIAGQWLGDFLVTAPGVHRLALLDAFFEAAQALAQAVDEVAPDVLAPVTDDVPAGSDLSPDALAGVRDGMRMLMDGEGSIARRKWLGYGTGAVSDERYMAAALALVGRSVDLVDALATLTGLPLRQVWDLVQPNLLDERADPTGPRA